MDSLLNRYRSIILLLVVLVAQLIFLAYQVKTDNDMRRDASPCQVSQR